MGGIAVVFGVVAAMVALFVSNRVPVALAALGGALTLYFTGILDREQALAGFGDPAVLFIGALFVVSASLEASGVTAWAGQILLRHAGDSRRRLLILTMLFGAALTALIGVGGAVAAILPIVVMVSVRLRRPPSRLLLPLVFGAHAGSMLVLTGSLVNVLLSAEARAAGLPPFDYLELTPVGLALVAGTVLLVLLLGDRLIPTRGGRNIPEDLSRHPRTLSEQYNVADGLVRLALTPASPYVGTPKQALEDTPVAGLRIIHVQAMGEHGPVRRATLSSGDTVLLRGDEAAVARFADTQRLVRLDRDPEAVRAVLFNDFSGFAEVVIPPRSGLIGQAVFPGMVTESGDLIILAVQRRGESLGPGEAALAAGDTLLLQGSWASLEQHLADPDVLVVDEPDLIRRQAVRLGGRGKLALAILVAMVVTLATGAQPTVIAGLVAAAAMVLFGVLTLDQAYRAINGTSLIMIASLIPLATAMYKTGAAALVADGFVAGVGSAGPYVLLGGLFALTVLSTQLISSTATALIVIPIAIAAANGVGVSPRAALVTVAVGAAACFLTPIASSANVMVQGPGGYRFGDYWRLGLPLTLWFFVVGTFLVPLIWQP